jgi:hypothetical protein
MYRTMDTRPAAVRLNGALTLTEARMEQHERENE